MSDTNSVPVVEQPNEINGELIQDPETTNFESGEDKRSSEDERFKDGQILRMVRVRFPGNAKSFPFLIGRRKINYGQKVVAMSDRGVAVGYVNSFPYDVVFDKSMLPVRSISKVATDEDIKKEQETYKREKEVETLCQALIENHQLDMFLTHVEFTQFGKKAVFYFIAPARVDFRNLVKDLVTELKMRIELRQISVRDRSAAVGGIGPCGRELCCSSFLSKYGNVSIKMAKNQDLTLNYSKLNGVCGQLKCCLQYEDEVYAEKRKRLPKEDEFIMTTNGELGLVQKIHLLSEMFDMLTDRGIRKRYTVEMFKHKVENPKFPESFENISDETHKVIGLTETEALKKERFEKDMSTVPQKTKDFAKNAFSELFGVDSFNESLPDLPELESTIPAKMIYTPDDEPELETQGQVEVMELDDEEIVEPMKPQFQNQNRERQQDGGRRHHHHNNNRNRNNNRPNNDQRPQHKRDDKKR